MARLGRAMLYAGVQAGSVSKDLGSLMCSECRQRHAASDVPRLQLLAMRSVCMRARRTHCAKRTCSSRASHHLTRQLCKKQTQSQSGPVLIL